MRGGRRATWANCRVSQERIKTATCGEFRFSQVTRARPQGTYHVGARLTRLRHRRIVVPPPPPQNSAASGNVPPVPCTVVVPAVAVHLAEGYYSPRSLRQQLQVARREVAWACADLCAGVGVDAVLCRARLENFKALQQHRIIGVLTRAPHALCTTRARITPSMHAQQTRRKLERVPGNEGELEHATERRGGFTS